MCTVGRNRTNVPMAARLYKELLDVMQATRLFKSKWQTPSKRTSPASAKKSRRGNSQARRPWQAAGSEQNAILVARIAANVVQLDASLKRTPAVRTYAATLLVCARTAEFDGGVVMDASSVDWMLIRFLCPGRPACRQNSPPSSLPPMRRSSSSSRPRPTLARRTATSRWSPTFGRGGRMVRTQVQGFACFPRPVAQASTSSTSARPGRSSFSPPVSSPLLRTRTTSVSSPPARTATVRSSSTPPTPAPRPSQAASRPVPSRTTSRARSRSPA